MDKSKSGVHKHLGAVASHGAVDTALLRLPSRTKPAAESLCTDPPCLPPPPPCPPPREEVRRYAVRPPDGITQCRQADRGVTLEGIYTPRPIRGHAVTLKQEEILQLESHRKFTLPRPALLVGGP